jgi:EAL and modified HD-GYP domain-containing signal transduction protein
MPSPYFYFRPILAADRSWVAFDWRRGETGDVSEISEFNGAEHVKCFNDAAAAPLANLLPLLTPIAPAALESASFADSFDPRHVIFALPGASIENKQTLARCSQLRSRGYRFGLHLDSADRLRKIPVATFGFLQLDSTFARQELSAIDLIYVQDAGFNKIATHVGSHEMFGWLSGKGFDWYESEFLTRRNPQSDREPDLTRLKLLKLLNLVKQDGDTREIEAIFREEPKLSYNLLRLVNSVAVGARTKISSFSQAIAILGRRQLQRWLQLLIYADNLADGHAPNPLMQIAAARGRQMELLVETIDPVPDMPGLKDNAFMTGLFSLLDVLINMPMNEILRELPLHDEVASALLAPAADGVLGQILSAIVAGESGNFATAAAQLSALGIGADVHAKAQVTALYWASRINTDNHD